MVVVLGYEKKGAAPLTQPEMHTMLNSMFQLLFKITDQAQQLLLVRDGLLFSILWQTCYRGFNAGGVRLENIVLPTWGNAVAYLEAIRVVGHLRLKKPLLCQHRQWEQKKMGQCPNQLVVQAHRRLLQPCLGLLRGQGLRIPRHGAEGLDLAWKHLAPAGDPCVG